MGFAAGDAAVSVPAAVGLALARAAGLLRACCAVQPGSSLALLPARAMPATLTPRPAPPASTAPPAPHPARPQALQLDRLVGRQWAIVACSAVGGSGLLEAFDWLVKDIAARIYLLD